MKTLLLFIAIVIFVCIAFQKLGGKLGVPGLFVFILLGMLFGSDGIFKIPFEDYSFANSICSIALIFIMFYGGVGTKWSTAKPVAVKAILLSSLGTVLTAGLVGLFCYFALGFELLLHRFAGTETRAGFIHVPRTPDLGTPSLELPQITAALTAAIEAC